MFIMDDDKLKGLKTEVVSVLSSSSCPLTVQQFLKEYRDVIGRHFPWSQHNCKNATEFLKSLTDILTFKNSDIGEVLVPIESNSSHISKLVKGQKKHTRKGAARRPRPFQLPRVHQEMLNLASQNDNNMLLRESICKKVAQAYETKTDNEKLDLRPLRTKVMQRPLPYRGWESPPLLMNVNLPEFKPQQSFSLASTQQITHQNLWKIDQMPQSYILNSFSTLQAEFTSSSTQLPLVPKQELTNDLQNTDKLMITNGCCEGEVLSYSNPIVEVKDDNAACVKANYPSSDSNLSEDNPISEDVKGCKTEPSEISLDEDAEEYNCPISENMKANFKKILSRHKDGILVSKLASSYYKMFKAVLNCQDYGFRTIKELVMACTDVFKIQPKKQSQDWLLYDINNQLNDSTRWIPSQVLENMQQLSLANPEGISSEDIPSKYKSLFQVELNIKKLGFDSLTSFLVNCQSIQCVMDDDKYIVFPMKWGMKNNEQEISNSDPFLSVDTYSIFSKKHFQENVCDYHFSYKKCVIPNEKTLKVYIADCISPDIIWLQTTDSAASLNELMYQLNIFYDEEEQNFLMKEVIAHPGLACCVKYNDKQWHRALIEEKFSDEVMVLYVDYGTKSRVPYSELRTLHKKFSEEAIFSFQSKLHDIQPVCNGVWSSQCNNFLIGAVYDAIFVAEIVEIYAEAASIILVDTRDSEDKVINIILVEMGYALEIVKPSSHPTAIEDRRTPNHPKETNNYNITNRHEKKKLNSKISEGTSPNDYFLQFLPYWLTDRRNIDEINDIFEQASQESREDNLAAVRNYVSSKQPTGKKILGLFLKKPTPVCNAWAKTFSSFNDEFEKEFLKNIEAEIEQSYKKYDGNNSSRIDNNYYESEIVLNNKENYNKLQINHPNKFDGPTSNYTDLNGSYQSKHSHHYHTPYEPIRRREDNYDATNFSIARCLVKANRPPKVITATLCDDVINLIRYNYEIYVLIDELLLKFAKGVPSMLIKHRLNQYNVNVTPFVVTSEDKPLYHELMRQKIDFKNGTASLVPLSLASNIVMAVQPRNRNVAYIFKELSAECYTSKEFWSIT